MKVLAITNQKGGVGKTTTAVNLTAALGEKGCSTLLIDLDPQANATSGMGLATEEGGSLYEVLIGKREAKDLVRSTEWKNVSMIPSEIHLAGCEVELNEFENPVLRLREILKPLQESDQFKVIVIDCPPSVGTLMTSALAAADGLIVPIQCEFYALEGIQKILELIQRMQPIHPTLSILGVLMTMYDARTKLSQQVLEDVRSHLPEQVFKTIIPRSVRLSEAPSFGKPITYYDSNGIGASAYRQLAEEVIGRLR